MKQKIAIGSDHAGFALKSFLARYLEDRGWQVLDVGASTEDSTDYPDYAHPVAKKLQTKEVSLGILICGSGVGMSIAANRHSGVRAALCWDGLVARLSRQHDDANILVLGARLVGISTAIDCVDEFLGTTFEGGRHSARIQKIEEV